MDFSRLQFQFSLVGNRSIRWKETETEKKERTPITSLVRCLLFFTFFPLQSLDWTDEAQDTRHQIRNLQSVVNYLHYVESRSISQPASQPQPKAQPKPSPKATGRINFFLLLLSSEHFSFVFFSSCVAISAPFPKPTRRTLFSSLVSVSWLRPRPGPNGALIADPRCPSPPNNWLYS